MTELEGIPAYDESLYRKTKRKRYKEADGKRAGQPVKHSRWVKKSGVPRYSKPQEKAIASRFSEQDGWHRGARVYV
jgi:hypothetical protein